MATGVKAVRKPLPGGLREEIIWSGPCAYCGDEAPTQVDHVVPLSRGGTDDRANLAPACGPCNTEKLDFTPDEWRAYREEERLGWPPKSRFNRLMEIARERGALPSQRATQPAGRTPP